MARRQLLFHTQHSVNREGHITAKYLSLKHITHLTFMSEGELKKKKKKKKRLNDLGKQRSESEFLAAG